MTRMMHGGPGPPCITLWMMHGGPGPPCITVRLRASPQPMLDTLTWLQYFDCLPHEYDTWCPHSISKMISASRRIFWDGFQPFLKNTWFFGLAFLAAVFRSFAHRNRLFVSSFNKKNDQCIKAHRLRWFPAILKKSDFWPCLFSFSISIVYPPN